jgi:hypothetical protein
MKLLIMQFSATSCHFISLWSKYSPQHPVTVYIQCRYMYWWPRRKSYWWWRWWSERITSLSLFPSKLFWHKWGTSKRLSLAKFAPNIGFSTMTRRLEGSVGSCLDGEA